MRLPNHSNRTRAGVTMIELMIVMTIILILMGLSLAGIQRFRGTAKELRVRNDIQQLQSAVHSFKTKYQVSYLASRIVLREDGQYGSHANATIRAWEIESFQYLKRVWPRLQTQVDWNVDGTITTGDAGAFVLEGDQCMVFFLGGIQMNGGCLGFSSNKANPMSTTGQLEGPIYDFQTDRLTLLPGNNFRTPFFLSYLDVYGRVPYLYFSSRVGNDYNALDCQSFGVAPYAEAANKWHNRDSFQILCAGKDFTFGPGGLYSKANGISEATPGGDDLTNFHDKKLGVGNNAP